MSVNLPNQPPQNAPEGFDYARPLTGNLDFYKSLWSTYRATRKLSAKKPRKLVRFIQQLWLPVDLFGLVATIFFGLPEYLFLWLFIVSLVPIAVLEILSFLTVLPVSFFTFRVKPLAIAVRFFLLGYLILLALGYTFILFFSPLILLWFYWRISRRSGGMLKTLLLSGHALNQAARQAKTTEGAATAKPRISFKVTKSSDLPPAEAVSPPEES
jgi:cation transport ATPase